MSGLHGEPDEGASMRTISREDFYKLEGLLALSKQHNFAMDAIQKAAGDITGEEGDCGYYGCTTDAIWNGESAEQLLNKLEIEVVDA